MIKAFLVRAVSDAARSAFPEAADAPFDVSEPSAGIAADLSTNAALVLAKRLSRQPAAIAEALASRLKKIEGFREVQAARNGFLNFTFTDAFLLRALEDRLQDSGPEPRPDRPILIEFVSANPTGPLHIGHGRGAALGDSLARVYRRRGFKVETEYYVNDMGIQMKVLSESVRARHAGLRGEKAVFPENGYQGSYIEGIARDMLAQGRTDFDRYPREALLDLIRSDLESFGVKFDHWFAESDLHSSGKVEKALKDLAAKGAVKEKDGALWFSPSGEEGEAGEKDKDRVLKKSDGKCTYFASDIAYHADKLDRGYGKCLDIWGHDHHGYVPRVEGALAALGAPEGAVNILLYQLVSLKRGGKRVSMSTRSGEFVTLKEVLDEAGRDACRFFFAMRSPSSQLEFDVDLAKRQSNENPVYYVQYVHARVCSIFKEGEKRGILLDETGPLAAGEAAALEAEERRLLLKLGLFEDHLDSVLALSSPHVLTGYLMDLAARFHKFYDRQRVLDAQPERRRARLRILKAVRETVRMGLDLLGVSAPERM